MIIKGEYRLDMNDIDLVTENTESKYSLIIAAAKRARELGSYLSAKKNMERINVVKPLVDIDSHDPLEIALKEFKEGKINYVKNSDVEK